MKVRPLKKDYTFFFKSTSGEHLFNTISQIITSNHEKAEKDPEHARDYVQRAKGAREILDHISSVIGTPDSDQ